MARENARRTQKKEVSSKQSYKYTSASDIRRALKSQDESSLIEALTALRNQLTVRAGEPAVAASDERLLLAKEWLDVDVGAQDVFNIWEGANARQHALLSVIVGLLSSVVSLLSAHYTYYSTAQPVVKTLLSSQWMHRLNTYLSGSHTELLLVALKLFNSLTGYAGGQERRAVFEGFAWETKSLPKLLHMRRKGKDDSVDMLIRPDIRTLYILFLLSFVDSTTTTSVKAAFLEQRRDTFISIFKGLAQDSGAVVKKVLEVCWIGLWSDPKVKRTLKVNIFNEGTLVQLLRLYERDSSESEEAQDVPADIVHHFLLAICTRPGVGVCFKDKGWYPRETEFEDRTARDDGGTEAEGAAQGRGRVHNKILANILKNLRVNEDPRQQELAMKILESCPELVAGYWPSAALTLEPRLSSKWIANISFFGSVISLPVPQSSFLSDKSDLSYQPTPPPLSTIVENILPSVNIKIHLSRGLQSSSALVQHSTALALAKCLMKYEAVLIAFETVERALEENEEEGQWSRRRKEIEREVRKRVPEFQVIVGFSQRSGESPSAKASSASADGATSSTAQPGANLTKIALLTESAQRLLWLYHRLLPSVVAEARFDVGKLLQGFQDMIAGKADVSASETVGLDTLRQLHVLRLLKESEQFTWSGKAVPLHSNLYVLLKAYTVTRVSALKAAISSLLCHSLANGILFQHDPDEISLWLESLPRLRRAPDARASDGAPLTDESEAVVGFLDDCAQRCVKTPYRYIEDLQKLPKSGDADDSMGQSNDVLEQSATFPSALVMTAAEQLEAKLRAKLLPPSDTLAVVTFIRKLVLKLMTKTPDLTLLRELAGKIDGALQPQNLFANYPVVTNAIRREISMLLSLLQFSPNSEANIEMASAAVEDFLSQMEHMPTPSSPDDQQRSAYELVDWLRLLDQPMTTSDVARLIATVERLYRPALSDIFEYLKPGQASAWLRTTYASHADSLRFDFDEILPQCDEECLSDTSCRQSIVVSLFQTPIRVYSLKRAIYLLIHRLAASTSHTVIVSGLFIMLATIMDRARRMINVDSFAELQRLCFQSSVIRSYCNQRLGGDLRQSFGALLSASLDAKSATDRQLVGDFAMRWSITLKDATEQVDSDSLATALMWIPFLHPEDVAALIDSLIEVAENSSNPSTIDLLDSVVQILARSLTFESTSVNTSRLLRLRSLLPASSTLEALLATVISGSLPLGYDGLPPSLPAAESSTISDLATLSTRRWSQRLGTHDVKIDIGPFLEHSPWTDSTVDIISGVVYKDSSSCSALSQWLANTASSVHKVDHLARVLYAVFDSTHAGKIAEEHAKPMLKHVQRLVRALVDSKSSEATRYLCSRCVCAMFDALSNVRDKLLSSLQKECLKLSSGVMNSHLLTVAHHIASIPDASDVVDGLVDRALSWAVRHFSETSKDSEAEKATLAALIGLFHKDGSTTPQAKAHMVEPVLASIIQNRLSDEDALRLAQLLLQTCNLKPASVNKYLQSIVQHTKFYESCAIGSTQHSARANVIAVLHTLFHLHPANTCQPSHIEPLYRIYGGSMSKADLQLLSIFQLFESTRKTSVASLFARWSSASDITSSSQLEALRSLDPNKVFRTCLMYPDWRSLQEGAPTPTAGDQFIYDPVFVTLLFAQMLKDDVPTSALSWVQLFRTNVVSMIIRALSAKDAQLRETAFAQIASLYKILQDADMQERPHILHILNLLKDTLPRPSEDAPRLPAYTTLLLAHALRGVFYPATFTYPLTARFLLQRPELDLQDVPMLFGMLYSASEEWKKERLWIVRLIADGMVGGEEWKVLKRRHTWDLLASLFQAEDKDMPLRRGILEVLANITCHPRATMSLVLKFSLLSWIEMQMKHLKADETIAWLKIVENIIVIVDAPKLESSMSGEWRSAIARCLMALLKSPACTADVFTFLVPIVLRLSLLPGPPTPHTPELLKQSLPRLRLLEDDNSLLKSDGTPIPRTRDLTRPLAPHRSQTLFVVPELRGVNAWGRCVEALWRVSMRIEEKSTEWDELSARLLLWRAAAGEEESSVGEWARKQVLNNLQLA